MELEAFERHNRSTGSDLLTQRVVDLVRTQDLAPGDRLPSVQALAGRFGVAAPTMREVLRRLQAVGMIEIRHGSGVYVRRPATALILPNPHPGRLERQVILDLLDARSMIEPTLAGLAAERATDAEIGELERTLEGAKANLEGVDRVLGRLNMDFHRTVARVSQHRILGPVIDSLCSIYEDEQLVVLRLYNDRVRDHQQHVGILEAIRCRDPAGARQRMDRHLRDVEGVFLEREGAVEEEGQQKGAR
ncbi:MAG: FadR family transcriptional regulator [Candidatus Dormibacteraeota bacterium]|nr:FadR family transcriptional regulator [Candidatus Dormibacteraeota bacterium]